VSRKTFSVIALITVIAAFLASTTWLINLRFESGDSYPVGSSLRADPLGAKALFESYDALSGVHSIRNFEPFGQMKRLPEDGLLVLLNMNAYSMYSISHYEAVEEFVSNGSGVLVALNPSRVGYKYLDDEGEFIDEADKESADGDESVIEDPDEDGVFADKDKERSNEDAFTRRATEKEERFWGEISLTHGEHEGGDAQATELAVAAGLPATLPWREGGILTELGDHWQPLYQIEDEVVMAQQLSAGGRIVVMTDDYLFSNEALLMHRYSKLLAWVIGDHQFVIFDETHLGVMESTGVAILMRRYRLEGFFLGFAVLMSLIVWRGMSPLLPSRMGRAKTNIILAEHSIEAGLSDLVQRSVPVSELPSEAFRQWKLSFLRNDADRAYYSKEVEEVETILSEYTQLSPRKRKPAETHSKIQSIMNRKKRKSL